MLWLSEVLLQEHDLDTFDGLCKTIQKRAQQGEMFFRIDVKPPYADTPEDWEDRLEAAFAQAPRS